MKWISGLNPRFENQVQTENEKPGNEKLNSRFTLKSPLLRETLKIAKLPQIVLNGLFKLGIALAFRGANELCSCTFFSCKKIGKI